MRKSWWDIRAGEGLVTSLMVLYHFLLLIVLYLLKPARDSLFLIELGAEQLPFVFVLIAVVGLPVTAAYSAASRRVSLRRLVIGSTVILTLCTLCLRWLLTFTGDWVFYLFYIWVSLFGILIVSQFWLMASAVFNAAQAKRLFALLALGGIAGAITGGWVTSLLVDTLGLQTRNLLLIGAGLLLATVGLVLLVWRHGTVRDVLPSEEDLQSMRPMKEACAAVRRSRYLVVIIGIIACGTLVSTLVDFQFKTIAAGSIGSADELTGFLGKFYGGLSIASVLLQALFAQRLLKRWGVGGAVLLMPVSLLLGSVGLVLMPGLLLATLVRGMEGSLSYSVDKTARELLFMPVPLEIKKRTKVFIDLFVDRTFQGIAGGLLLAATAVFAAPELLIGLLTILLLGVWLLLGRQAGVEYVNAFRKALQSREIDPQLVRIDMTEASTRAALVAALGSANEREVVYALRLLGSVKDVRVVAPIRDLLLHRSAEVRRLALEVLSAYPRDFSKADVEPLLTDPDMSVIRQAVRTLSLAAPEGNRCEFLSGLLRSESSGIRLVAAECIEEECPGSGAGLVDPDMIRLELERTSPEDTLLRQSAARLVGRLRIAVLYEDIRRLLNEDDPDTVRAVIEGMALTGDLQFVSELLGIMVDGRYRRAALEALAGYGEPVLSELARSVLDDSLDWRIRMAIPRIISRVKSQQSADLLLQLLPQVPPNLRFAVVRSMNKLRDRHRPIRFTRKAVVVSICEESRLYHGLAVAYQRLLSPDGSPAAQLLQRALREKLAESRERMFRLLGLINPGKDILNAYRAVVDSDPVRKGNAIELLDNLLGPEEKPHLMSSIDSGSSESLTLRAEQLYGLTAPSRADALVQLISGRDRWLQACAVYASTGETAPSVLRAVETAEQTEDALVRDTCRLVLAQAPRRTQ